MARTFIGELILRLKDEMSGKAKTAASNLDTSIGKIERAAQRMNSIPWGGKFDEQIRKLGASSKDIEALGTSWSNLNKAFAENNLSKSMAAMEKANWKTSALSTFADIATRAKEADTNIGSMHARWKDAMKDMAMYGTAGALLYGGVNAVRGGVRANAQFQREQFLEKNANIPEDERNQILAEADRLTTKYPSAGLVNVLEMARTARGMMGDTKRGLEILPDLVKGLVALQTSNTDPEVANDALGKLLRGIDNAGKNSAGDLGIQNTKEIIAGLIRASQVEGKEINVGDLWTFMRRAKIAGPGFSTEFIANVVPALIQDMGAPGAGTALSSDFQAYVIGSNAVASKDNIAEQKRLKIRKNGKLVNAELMANNPYRWATEVLLPALQADGVDVDNDAALAEAIAKTSRNTNATAMLTKMLQQRAQIDRTIEQYQNAVGPDSADVAAAEDPFVAWKGFIESWRELATSIRGMPEATAGLNTLTDGIQRFSTALREKDGLAQLTLAGAGAAGLFGAWKVTAAIWGLMTAGTNLNAAAVALQAAAVSLGAGGAVGDIPGKSGKGGIWSKIGGLLPWLGRASLPVSATVSVYEGLNSVPHDGMASALKDNPNLMVEMENYRRRWQGTAFEGGMHRAGLGAGPKPQGWDNQPGYVNPYQVAMDLMERRIVIEQETMPPERKIVHRRRGKWEPRSDSIPVPEERPQAAGPEVTPTVDMSNATADTSAKPTVDMSNATAAASEASSVGQQIQSALSVSATPQVNLGQLQQAVALARQFVSIMQQASSAVTTAHQSVAGEMRRNFADHGVSP